MSEGRLNIRFSDPPAVRAHLRRLQAAFEAAGRRLTFGQVVETAVRSVDPDRVAELLADEAS
jgi:hypothetical protein